VQDHALPRLAHQIEHALDDTRAITPPLGGPELGGPNDENAAHASIFLGNEHLDLSLGRVAVRNPEAHEPRMANVSKFRATEPRIDGADVQVRVGSKGRSYPLGSPCLPGWRRSADRAGLQANSLPTGNFTGKIAISGLRELIW
jgi:hypothetical protein